MAIFQKRHPLTREDLENGNYKSYTMKQLASKFFSSRFNRDPYVPVDEDEDINNSRRYRLYNKDDIIELTRLFVEFFEELICTENIENINFSKNIVLYRDARLPLLKNVTAMDRKVSPDIPEGDEFYISRGRYTYHINYRNEVRDGLDKLWESDPRRKRRLEELIPECKKRNEEVKKSGK